MTHVASLGGLWTYRSHTSFAGQHDYLYVDEARERIIVFVVCCVSPYKRSPMRFWYRWDSGTCIHFRMWNRQNWQTQHCELEGDTLSWTYGGEVHPWKRVPAEQYPEWLDESLARAYVKMDEVEAAGGGPQGIE